MARPRKVIDVEQIKKLAAINCSHDEIGSVMGVHKRTLERGYAAAIKEGRDHGKMSLKRKMWETAMGGNVTMMIWLSKQMLGYTDKVEEKKELKAEVTEIVYTAQWGGTSEPATQGSEGDS